MSIESCDVTAVGWSSTEHLVRAKVVSADLAELAATATYARLNGDSIPLKRNK